MTILLLSFKKLPFNTLSTLNSEKCQKCDFRKWDRRALSFPNLSASLLPSPTHFSPHLTYALNNVCLFYSLLHIHLVSETTQITVGLCMTGT